MIYDPRSERFLRFLKSRQQDRHRYLDNKKKNDLFTHGNHHEDAMEE
eukprot:gene1117-10631_t